MEQFNQEELKNIAILIQNSPIKGNESLTVANLLIKIQKLLTPEPEKIEKETKK